MAVPRLTNSPPMGFALRPDVLARPNPSDAPRDRTSTCAYARTVQATPIVLVREGGYCLFAC